MRTLLIAGNWKLNPTTAEAAAALADGVRNGLGSATDVHVALAPPFVFLTKVDQVLELTGLTQVANRRVGGFSLGMGSGWASPPPCWGCKPHIIISKEIFTL